MNGRRAIRAIATGNVLVALLAGLWGCTSYMYNWLNVGGGIGDVDSWRSMREEVPPVALISWIVLVLSDWYFHIGFPQAAM